MDQLKSTVDSVMGNSTGTEPKPQGQQQSSTSSSSGGNEGLLDKGVNYAQETFVGAQGAQGTASQPQEGTGNQSAVEQAKDEQISDFLRHQYKSSTGSDGKDGK